MKKKEKKRSWPLSLLLGLLIGSLTVVSILLITQIFISIYRGVLADMAATSSEQAVSQAANTVRINEKGMKDDLGRIINRLSLCETEKKAQELISDMAGFRSDVVSVMIYDMDGKLLLCGSNGLGLKEVKEKNLSFNKKIFDSTVGISMLPPHVQNLFLNYYPWVVTIAEKTSMRAYDEPVYVAMDFNFTSIASYVDNVGIGPHGYCYIMDREGNIVYHPQQQLIYAGLKKESTLYLGDLADGVYPGGSTISAIKTLNDGSWRIVGVSYTDELIGAKIREIQGMIIRVAVIFIALAVSLSILVSRVITRPVKKLIRAMQEFEKNAEVYDYQPVKGVQEVRNLSDSFDHMVKIIQELMNRVKMEEISLRKTELKALQAQINPHFLYNTLDSIQWMCEQEKSSDAVKMVSALARLFRISISRGRELIPIADEISHARSYLLIQSYRYKNQFTYEFDIEEDVADYYCNKITLQPMIENAIYHGIDRMVDEGLIRITARTEGDDIVFLVSDNGAGMTKEQCEGVLSKESSDSSGIGIKNVNDRIKIYFGESYQIQIDSEPDVGTTIRIRFPKIREDDCDGR